MPKPLELTGEKFGRLTVLEKKGLNKFGKTLWLCECSCGTRKEIIGSQLKNGTTKSCGCLNKEKIIERNYSHGKSYTRLYRIWRNMKDRCSNLNRPDYQNYGKRGITVCEQWQSNFESFYEWSINNGYADDLSIDRIDGNKGYSLENCRWATAKSQARNIRTNVNTLIDGEYLSISAIAEKYNVSREAVRERYKKGKRGMDLIKGLKKTGVTVKPESISYSVEV